MKGIFNKIKGAFETVARAVEQIQGDSSSASRDIEAVKNALAKEENLTFTILDSRHALITINPGDGVPATFYVFAATDAEGVTIRTAVRGDVMTQMARTALNTSYTTPITTGTKTFTWESLSSRSIMRDMLMQCIRSVGTLVRQLATASDFKPQKLDVMVFDKSYVASQLRANKYFKEIDSDGDVKLICPKSSSCVYDIVGWAILKPDRITVDSTLIGATLKGANIDAAVGTLSLRYPDVEFRYNDNGLRLKIFIDPEDYTAECSNANAASEVKSAFDKIIAAWPKVLRDLGIVASASDGFDVDAIRKQLRDFSGFEKVDGDGDVRLRFAPTGDFAFERFVWVYPAADKVRLDCGFFGFDAAAKGKDLNAAVAKFNAANNDVEAYVFKNESIRLRRTFRADAYPKADRTDSIMRDLSHAIIGVAGNGEELFKILGIKTDFFRPTVSVIRQMFSGFDFITIKEHSSGDMIYLQLPESKTTDGDILSCAFVSVVPGASEISITSELWTDPVPDSKRTPVAKALAASLGGDAKWRLYNESNTEGSRIFPFDHFAKANDFKNYIIDCLKALIDVQSEMDDIVLEEMNNRLRAECEERRRRAEEQARRQAEEARRQAQDARRREREAAQEREDELSAYFTLTLRPTTTVRKLQEWFTEDYPYLRLGFYMVKTGQAADRSGDTISSYSSDTVLGDIRSFKGECQVTIRAGASPKDIEKEFRSKSGLVVKICYNDEDDNRYYISNDSDYYTTPILDLNRDFRKAGFNKADIS